MDSAEIVAVIVAVAHLMGLVTSVYALLSVRTPQGTTAWVISLNTFPYLAVPAYWVFGRTKFQGYVVLRRSETEEVRRSLSDLEQRVAPYRAELGGDQGRIQATERLALMPFLGGNTVELLVDGTETFDSILAGIDRAERYLLVQFYIVKDDAIGRELQQRMIAAAGRGVRVTFLYDEIGSNALRRRYLDPLRKAGIAVRPFHTTRGSGNRFQLNFRNHRKIVVVDGDTGWVGGHNVGDEYLGRDPKFGAWRDTHVRIDGPAVLGLQLSFVEDWHWAGGAELELEWDPRKAPGGEMAVLTLPSGPADPVETASLMFQHAIHAAQQRVWIASPYFVPDEGVTAALQLACLRGVDVRILIPDHPDHLLVYLSAFAFVGEMLDAGVEIYRYEEGFLHAKSFLIDDEVAGVGTANLDNRSFRLNFEVTAIVADRAFAAANEAMLLADFERSRRMTRAELDDKSMAFKVAARAAYLTAPVQ